MRGSEKMSKKKDVSNLGIYFLFEVIFFAGFGFCIILTTLARRPIMECTKEIWVREASE